MVFRTPLCPPNNSNWLFKQFWIQVVLLIFCRRHNSSWTPCIDIILVLWICWIEFILKIWGQYFENKGKRAGNYRMFFDYCVISKILFILDSGQLCLRADCSPANLAEFRKNKTKNTIFSDQYLILCSIIQLLIMMLMFL